MINEVKFSKYVDTGEEVTKINLGDFIKLYINHRPALGLSMKTIQRAFQVLGYDNKKGDKVIDRGDFLSLLQCRGELVLFLISVLCLLVLPAISELFSCSKKLFWNENLVTRAGMRSHLP